MAEGSGFDMSKMTTAGKILLGGGVLYLLDLFMAWNKACVGGGDLAGLGVPDFCVSANGLHGLGNLNLILVIVIVAMEVIMLAGVTVNVSTPAQRALIGAGITWVLAVLTLLKVLLIDNESLAIGAWIGLVLALVIAYGGFMRFQEGKSAGGAAPPAEGGGFSS